MLRHFAKLSFVRVCSVYLLHPHDSRWACQLQHTLSTNSVLFSLFPPDSWNVRCVSLWVLQKADVKMGLDIQESYCGGNGEEPSDANSGLTPWRTEEERRAGRQSLRFRKVLRKFQPGRWGRQARVALRGVSFILEGAALVPLPVKFTGRQEALGSAAWGQMKWWIQSTARAVYWLPLLPPAGELSTQFYGCRRLLILFLIICWSFPIDYAYEPLWTLQIFPPVYWMSYDLLGERREDCHKGKKF